MLRSSSRALRHGTSTSLSLGFRNTTNLRRFPALQGLRAASTVTDLNAYPSIGEKLHGFTVQEKKHVPELHLTAVRLKHDNTDADYLHVARDDKNNVFGVGFKTNPPDATGVPHILEHTTLCGSEKYPVRDPFFKMLPRSLSNFMNAFTSSDHTTYPFATTNKKDFQNLLSVYLDATLHPLLKEEDFRQEGWRLGPENPRAAEQSGKSPDEAAPGDDIVFKGVVYNEMKGQITDANYLYYIKFKEHIFPAINNSGGDPEYITDLTHKQLVSFSKQNYHPSNAKVFTYGDMPLADHLKQIGAVLDGFQKKSSKLDVKLPRDLSAGPLNFTVEGPMDPFTSEDKQCKSSVSWRAGDSTDEVEVFSLGILSSLLLDGYGSPMYRALIESGLGSSFTPNTGLDTSGRIPIFSVGLNGVSESDVPAVKQRVEQVFKECMETGLNREKVSGYLHQLELALRHKTANFGLGVMEKTLSAWFNGFNPTRELAWNDIISEFEKRWGKTGYLENLMKKYFMNDECLTFTMNGSPTYNQALAEKEMARKEAKMAELAAKFGSADAAIEQLKKEELELLKVQESAQNADVSCLPTLHIKDIPREMERKPVRESKIDDVEVVWREAPTNGLSYIQALNVYSDIPDELRLLLPLFNEAVMRLGTAQRTMEQWEDLTKLKTGGVSSSTFSVSSPLVLGNFTEGLQFTGYAMDKNVPDMLEIITTLVTEADFSSEAAPKMVQELLRSNTNGALDAVAGSGHRFAVNAAAAGLSKNFWVQEQKAGLSQIQAVADLLRDAENSPEKLRQLIEKLRLIQSFAISKSPKLRIRVVCESGSSGENEAILQRWLSRLPKAIAPPTTSGATSFSPSSSKILYDLPFQVSYSGLALRTTPFTGPDSAPLSVLSQLLTHKYLHPEIREKGGAYGAGASNGPIQGLFSFSSYRDPNPMNTFKVFNNSGVFARDRTWIQRELDEAKLGIFQSLDAPMSVDEEGQRYFLTGVTQDMDQRWREQVLDVTAQDVNRVAQKYLIEGTERVFCLLGNKDNASNLDGWDVRNMSMGNDAESAALAQDAASVDA
ncbi:presequence protease [Coccidioides immitis H538.4]|uniref:Presequence protease, mitochondrial n=1 Tax=Coccidioides immitis H538.4 TaxID=396776 RepID=A0A0J8RYB5_COCIT|nr:presequence protease [Coccidioides immitis H538.4]